MASHKQTQSLYVECQFPDIRKRIYVSLVDENIFQSVVVQQDWTLKCLLNYLKSSFKVSDSIKYVSLFTTDKVMITSLDVLVHNQVLRLTPGIETPIIPYVIQQQQPEKKQPTSTLIHDRSEVDHSDDNKSLYDLSYDCKNPFLDIFYELKRQYKHLIQIGESKPYTATLYLASHCDRTDSSAWIVFKNDMQPDQFTYSIHMASAIALEYRLKQNFKNLTSVYQLPQVLEAVMLTFQDYYQKAPGNAKYPAYMDGELVSFFPSDYIEVNSITKSQFILECKEIENKISQSLGVCQSIIKNLLFKFKLSSIKCTGYINKNLKGHLDKNDVRHLKFIDTDGQSCPICFDDDLTVDQIVQLACGHYMCTPCFTQFIDTEVEHGLGNGFPIQCPDVHCPLIIDSSTISATLTKSNLFENFKTQLFRDYKISSGSPQCAVKNCKHMILNNPDLQLVLPFSGCTCQSTLCYHCGASAYHWPHYCKGNLNELFNEDLETIKYLLATSTLCPSCQYPVQKTTGCNHIKCGICNTDFCYVCGLKYVNGGHPLINGAYGCPGDQRRKLLIAKGVEKSVGLKASTLLALHGNPDSPARFLIVQFQEFSKSLEGNFARKDYQGIKEKADYCVSLFKEYLEEKLKKNGKRRKEIVDEIQKCTHAIASRFQIKKNGHSHIEPHVDDRIKIKTVSCTLSINGVLDEGINLFVKTNMSEWKIDILESLGLSMTKDNESKFTNYLNKMIIYNLGGNIIKSSRHVVLGERIFIALQGEDYLDPQIPNENEISPRPSSSPTGSSSNKKRSNKRSSSPPPPPPPSSSPSNIYQELEDLRSNPIYRDAAVYNNEEDEQLALLRLQVNGELKHLLVDQEHGDSDDDDIADQWEDCFDQGEEEDWELIEQLEQIKQMEKMEKMKQEKTNHHEFQVDALGWQVFPAIPSSPSRPLSIPCGLSATKKNISTNHNHLEDFLDDDFLEKYDSVIENFEKVHKKLLYPLPPWN
ncbi:hypothetical protein DFA_09407 [Cavenderia fasciculata]|uniref:RBR-type E3 ubiquitin transferase n=1 Tax=Cavenderia fasciculata TaxID=261658 RepID=F4Q7J4_CACFS|nr:uncharacterized protein DFA_09407 [Cavenderia fasciculata]EGG16376.1 hypothetical protein DFA_09407 [Cavenderia fasciculata]|eukprot:XP_004354760.1 hypothetical protein DFA_09407 [Cavenderia fasciculata]